MGFFTTGLAAVGQLFHNSEAGPHLLHCQPSQSSSTPVIWNRLEQDYSHADTVTFTENGKLNNKGIRTPPQERHTEIQDVKHFYKKGRHSPGCQDYTAQFRLIYRLIGSPRHEGSKKSRRQNTEN